MVSVVVIIGVGALLGWFVEWHLDPPEVDEEDYWDEPEHRVRRINRL